jgi:HEAT repeat protein
MLSEKELQDASPETLIEILNGEEDINALRGLGSLAESLRPFVTDDQFLKRVQAAERLGVLKERRAFNPLLAALGDYNPQVRVAAVKALGMLGDRKATKSLLATLKDVEPPVRAEAAQTLGKLGDKRALNALESVLFDSEPSVVQAVQTALATLERP